MGVVVRRYIDFLILLIPTPRSLFCSSIPSLLFVHFLKCFSFFSNIELKKIILKMAWEVTTAILLKIWHIK